MPEPIEVTIRDETGVESVSVGTANKTESNQSLQNSQTKANEKSNMISAAGTYVAMATMNYVTSNVGKYTGNQRLQNNINNAKRVAGHGLGLAANLWMGLAIIAVDGTTTIADYMWERKWDTIRAEQKQARNGDLGGFRR